MAAQKTPLAGLILMAVIYAITTISRLLDGALVSGSLCSTKYAKSVSLTSQNGTEKEKKKTYKYPPSRQGDKIIFEGNGSIDLKAKTITTKPYNGKEE